MIPSFFVLIASALAQSSTADCPSTSGQVQAALVDTFVAINSRDTLGYQASRDRALTRLACLTEVIPAEVAADLHVVLAFDAIGPGDDQTLKGALRAYALLRPDAPLESRLKLPGKMSDAAEAARKSERGPTDRLPDGGRFWLDGTPATEWPTDRTAVLQAEALDDSSRIWTTTLQVGGPLPRVPGWALPAPESESRRKVGAGWLWAAAGASAATTGGLWWAALQERSSFDDLTDAVAESGPLPDSQRQDADAIAARANRLGVAAQALSGVTVGLTTIALVVSF